MRFTFSRIDYVLKDEEKEGQLNVLAKFSFILSFYNSDFNYFIFL